jgi:phosphatidylinositol phospholipase C delta
MDFVGFQTFMTSSANSCYVPPSAKVRHTRPLNEYFISSSHNTYLTGRQVVGESSTEAYITALQKGCRCLEIDCWNGNDKQPIVNHGRTLTSSISFRDTIKVINQYAFCETPYPLILSLEVHCDREQQARMAEIMIEEFGEKLVQRPLDDSTVLPSPEELKGRILIKVKAAAEELDAKSLSNELSGRTRDRSISSPWSRPVQLDNSLVPSAPLLSSPQSLSPPERTSSFWASPRTSCTSTNGTVPSPSLISSADDSDSPHVTDTEKKKKKSATSKIITVLGDLGVYTKGVKFTNFRSAEAATHNHVFSIAERTFRKLTESDSPAKKPLEEHNMRYLMRVYPSFHRVTSTNFEPLSYWRSGVQMAALNWQTYDLGQQLNEAMFTGGNDRTGYVLKPAALRLEQPTPVVGIRPAPKKVVRFSVNIISAQQLPRPKGLSPDANINPYVEFETYCADDMGPNASGTRIVPGNGYNPEFGENINVKLVTRYPSLVFVRWSVWNSRDAQNTERAPLATFTAKLDSLQQGYRHLPLFDSNGEQYLFSTLFCKIDKKECVQTPGDTPSDLSSSITYSVESAMPMLETNYQQNGRSFLRKLIHRTPSGSRRRNKDNKFERTYSDSKDLEPDNLSRHSSTSALEKCGTLS